MDQLSAQDVACLRMLAGAHFGPKANLTLLSGRVISSGEAQALTSAYASDTTERADTDPAPRETRAPGTSAPNGPLDLYLQGGGSNPRAIEILTEAQRSHDRRNEGTAP